MVVGLALFVLLLLGRVGGLEERVARLEGRREEQNPYRAAPALPVEPAAVGSAGEDARILEALQQGNKIEAIKRYRELTGAGLKESKEAIEAIRVRSA